MALDIAALVLRGLATDDTAAPDSTTERIIDAAVTEIAAFGVTKLTIGGLARRAGVNRATVYRRFGDLDGVVEAMTMREGRRITTAVFQAIAGVSDPAQQLVEGFVTSIRLAREHPVISRTARLEPGELIAAGLADDSALLRLGSNLVAAVITEAKEHGYAAHLDPGETGQTLAMLFAACVLLPSNQGVDLRTDESTRAYAQRTLAPMIFGPPS